ANIPDDFKYSTNVAACEPSIRSIFIRKVYTLLVVQLFITFTIASSIKLSSSINQWCLNHIWLMIVATIGTFVFLLISFLSSRKYPYNLFSLFAFTLCESYCVGIITSLYDTNIILQAIVLTITIFIGLTLFAFQSKYDFTSWLGFINILFFGLIGFSLVLIFVPYNSKLELIYSSISALIFSVYILIDTQLIMRSFHPEDEIAATITLYLDIINLFLNLLRILS
ncbi:Bxi1p, partial [Ascoidea rubescens DSM 1968]